MMTQRFMVAGLSTLGLLLLAACGSNAPAKRVLTRNKLSPRPPQ